jgi:alanine racemase
MDAKHSLGEPRLLISRSALLHNIAVLRHHLAPGVKLCAMIKADAYGHGAAIAADALANLAGADATGAGSPAADQLAVATIDEAAQLPADVTLPITVMRQVEHAFLGRQREAIELAIRRGWTLTLASPAAADDVARIAIAVHRRAVVHVMIDTGMTRCGAPVDQIPELLARIESHASLRLTSLSTHFANSEVAHDPYTQNQLRHFMMATNAFVAAKGGKVIRHAANSGGIFFTPRAHLDMVRPGISLYGIDPTCRPSLDRSLKPVLKWTAPLAAINEIKAGTSIGYNQTFIAPRDMRVGLIPVGYADGYLRALSNKGVMLVGGERCPVLGRVSMDLTTIDLARASQAHVGDEVTVIDDDPLSPASAYELARLAETIPYELFTRIGPRVRRVAVEPEDSDILTAEEVGDGYTEQT